MGGCGGVRGANWDLIGWVSCDMFWGISNVCWWSDPRDVTRGLKLCKEIFGE